MTKFRLVKEFYNGSICYFTEQKQWLFWQYVLGSRAYNLEDGHHEFNRIIKSFKEKKEVLEVYPAEHEVQYH